MHVGQRLANKEHRDSLGMEDPIYSHRYIGIPYAFTSKSDNRSYLSKNSNPLKWGDITRRDSLPRYELDLRPHQNTGRREKQRKINRFGIRTSNLRV